MDQFLGQLAPLLIFFLHPHGAIWLPFGHAAIKIAIVVSNFAHFLTGGMPRSRHAFALAFGKAPLADFVHFAVVNGPSAMQLTIDERGLRDKGPDELLIG